MSLPRYGEYKESGVPWLGAIPSHWELHPTKRHFQRRKELNAGMACEYRLALTMNGVVPRSLGDLDGLQSSDYEGYQLFEPGDLAFKLIDLQNIKTSRVGLVQERGIMSPAYIRLQPRRTTVPRYAYWYFMALYWTQVFNSLGGGVRQTLGPEELLTVEYPVPTLFEQTAIAAFLDCETAKIDALITEQEKLIALLAEKRQATISHAVTRGLNPNAPMKDSGVAWLGEVPTHWDVGRLKRFSDVIDCKHYTVEFLDDGLPIASIRELRDNRIDLTDANRTSPREWEYLREGRVPVPGDLVFCRNASVGAVGYVSDTTPSFCMGQDVCLIRPRTKSRFMYYQLIASGTTRQIEALLVGATIRRANVAEIRNLVITWPLESEQICIAAFLDAETEKLDTLRLKAERAVQLLMERRSALIVAAVTGQIDVRNQGKP
ncbi:restriction endonuclease subunit S [Achromobacter denitrificans]|uniref:Restriction endonuclease subunit S n=1 Tax=Achromobacter denitrificans TaxID=32002 RepID=A0ABZ3G361_ACHDE